MPAKKVLLVAAAALLLSLPAAYFLRAQHRPPANEQLRTLSRYLKAVYARDFTRAYRFISSQDRQFKPERTYVRERQPFAGFAAELAQKLADWIEARPVDQRPDGERIRVKLALTLPDANALAPLLLNWDEESLNRLRGSERKRLLTALERLKRDGQLKMVEGDEEFILTKEGKQWKVFLDWATGIHVSFGTRLPEGALLEAEPTVRETVGRSGDLFTIAYRVKNRSQKEVVARIVHRVEPDTLADHLDLVECALLLPVRIRPGEEQSYSSTYMIRGDLPEGAKELKVTYEFKVER